MKTLRIPNQNFRRHAAPAVAVLAMATALAGCQSLPGSGGYGSLPDAPGDPAATGSAATASAPAPRQAQPAGSSEKFSTLASAQYSPAQSAGRDVRRPMPDASSPAASSSDGSVPPAPYRSTPAYESEYADYWESVEAIEAGRQAPAAAAYGQSAYDAPDPAGVPAYGAAPTAYGDIEEVVVTADDSARYAPNNPAPTNPPGSQTLYSSRTGPEGYQAPGVAPIASGNETMPEIPAAPANLPSGSSRYVTADGSPYPESAAGVAASSSYMPPPAATPSASTPSASTSSGSLPTRAAPASQYAAGPVATSDAAMAAAARPDMSGGLPDDYAPPLPSPASRSGQYAVHLASYRVRDRAVAGWNILYARHAAALAGLEPRVTAAEIPGLGLHYRLKAGPLPESAARSVCSQIQPSGDYCAVMPFDGEPL